MKKTPLKLFVLLVLLISSCSKDTNIEELKELNETAKTTTISERHSTENLSIISYNTYHLPGIAAILHYKEDERAKLQSEIINSMSNSIDVIAFQEGFNRSAERFLFNGIKGNFPYSTKLVGKYCSSQPYWNSTQGNCSNSMFVTSGGVNIYSKYPIIEKHQYIFNNSARGTADYSSNKGAIYIVINKNGKKYHIVSTHLQADQGSFNGSKIRMKQLKEISEWLKKFNISRNEPLIYSGDMNVEYTDTKSYVKMQRILNSKINYTYNPRFTSYSNVTNTIVKKNYPKYNNTLDYILISDSNRQPIYLPKMEILRFYKNGIDLSDHHPIKTVYTFQY